MDFNKAIVDTLLNEHNLYKIKAKSQYDDEKCEWEIPPFVLKGKAINFPKLGLQKAKRFIEEEKENQVVDFQFGNGYDNDYQIKDETTSKSMVYHRTNKKKERQQNLNNRKKSQVPK